MVGVQCGAPSRRVDAWPTSSAGPSAAHKSWANTSDREARLAPARRAFLSRFSEKVDPEGKLPPRRGPSRPNAKQAYYLQLAFKGQKAGLAKRQQAS